MVQVMEMNTLVAGFFQSAAPSRPEFIRTVNAVPHGLTRKIKPLSRGRAELLSATRKTSTACRIRGMVRAVPGIREVRCAL